MLTYSFFFLKVSVQQQIPSSILANFSQVKAVRINKEISKENHPDLEQIFTSDIRRKWLHTTEEKCIHRNRLDLCAGLNFIAFSFDRL